MPFELFTPYHTDTKWFIHLPTEHEEIVSITAKHLYTMIAQIRYVRKHFQYCSVLLYHRDCSVLLEISVQKSSYSSKQ